VFVPSALCDEFVEVLLVNDPATRPPIRLNTASSFCRTAKEFPMNRRLMTIAALAAMTIPATGHADGQKSAKPMVSFNTLKCYTPTESSDQLEVRVYRHGQSRPVAVWQTNMVGGKVWKLRTIKGARIPLRADLRFELWEIDRELFGKDDKLAVFTIKKNKKTGKFNRRFHGVDRGPGNNVGWFYELNYQVDR
jgi:hypothetical protein